MVTHAPRPSGMIGMNCKSDTCDVRGGKSRLHSHKVIVIAGVPRSGSTWVFNAARLVLEKTSAKVYAAWCEDYTQNTQTESDFHVVKLHRPDQLTFQYDYLLTTRRELVQQLGSLIRMGWLSDDPVQIRRKAENLQSSFVFWEKYSNLLIEYQDIVADPKAAISQIGSLLEKTLTTQEVNKIADDLEALKAPNGNSYDLKTLLHPNHRAQPEERDYYIHLVKQALA